MNLYTVLLVMLAASPSVMGYLRVCYYTNWSQYRPEGTKFYPESIDTSLCSHIIYAFATMEGNRLKAYEWNDESTDWMKGMYERFTDLKLKEPSMKTLIAVGGWNFGTEKMTAMMATAANRQEFVTTSIEFLRLWKFDGLDLDFEYPGNRGSPPTDKYAFTALVQELKAGFAQEAAATGRPRLLLTAAVGAGNTTIKAAYEIDKICSELDIVNLMSYDLNGAWNNVTGHNSPLFSRADETEEQSLLNTAWAADYWSTHGCPKTKMAIGIGTYGRGFTLCNSANTAIGACASGPSIAGTYTREGGFLSYYEICPKIMSGAPRIWQDEHKVPYTYFPGDWQGYQWVGYDDKQSVNIKVNWLKSQGYGGFMTWSLDLDDFVGSFCGEGRYPLLAEMNRALGLSVTTTTTTTGSATTTQSSTTTTAGITTPSPTTTTGSSTSPCAGKTPGDYPHQDCDKFYSCVTEQQWYEQRCPPGTIFDVAHQRCDYIEAVPPENRDCVNMPA